MAEWQRSTGNGCVLMVITLHGWKLVTSSVPHCSRSSFDLDLQTGATVLLDYSSRLRFVRRLFVPLGKMAGRVC